MKTILITLISWFGIVGITTGAVETFALFAPSEKPEDVAVLAEVLAPDQTQSVAVLKSPAEVVKSPAEVLLLFLNRQDARSFTKTMLPELKKKKIIGIGYGAAEIFGDLKLEIKGGACAHGQAMLPIALELPKDALLPPTPVGPLKAYEPVALPDEPLTRGHDINFAMHLPRNDPRATSVTALALWRGDGNYAPIVRQGDYIMVGIAPPATTWTKEYKALFGGIAARFAKAPRVGPAKMEWKETPPGVLNLALAQLGNTEELSGAEHRFRIVKPGRFTALLEHGGSSSVMLLFAGPQGMRGIRKDAKKGEPLSITMEITQEDITKAGNWLFSSYSGESGRKLTTN